VAVLGGCVNQAFPNVVVWTALAAVAVLSKLDLLGGIGMRLLGVAKEFLCSMGGMLCLVSCVWVSGCLGGPAALNALAQLSGLGNVLGLGC